MKEPSQRCKDILAKMTVEEKALQLSCIMPSMALDKGVFNLEKAKKAMPKAVGRMTQFASGFTEGPRQAAEGYNAIQKYAIETCGLPVLIQNESSSGLVAADATIFPVPIGVASSWDPELSYEMGKVIGTEGRAIGPYAMMSPVADIARDGRWGRVDETYGEDPMLAARMTSEQVHGIQGDDYTKHCAALAKHWVGYGVSEGGINCATINIGKKDLFEVYATPFAAAIKEHDMQSIMVTYSDIDGLPMSVNEEYTKKILRDDIGFTGIAVCDGHSIPRCIDQQGMFEDRAELAGAALKAGIDADTMTTTVYNHIVEGVEKGVVDVKDLDECVLRTLQAREEMGLLDNAYVDPDKAVEIFADPAADQLSYDIAEKSVILLKNENKTLPLSKDLKKVAIIGPFGKRTSGYFGGYAYPCMMSGFLKILVDPDPAMGVMEGFEKMIYDIFDVDSMKAKMYTDPTKSFDENVNAYLEKTLGTLTLVDAMKQEMPDTEFTYHIGTWNVDNWAELIEEAKEVAKDADAVILAVGEITATGGKDTTSGEGVNHPNLELPHHQDELVRAIGSIGKPTSMVIFNGRALALASVEKSVGAIVDAWYPGPSGALPVARVLAGKVNPSGHLPVTFPQYSEQCPIYYGTKTGSGYLDMYQRPLSTVLQPLYPFGHGLSYTTFKLSNLKNDASVETGAKFKVSVDIENTGDVAGEDVVQIYTHSIKPTINRPIKELRGFKKVFLEPGQKKTVEFTFDTRNFGYYNKNYEFVIEPRPQEIFACYDSSTIAEKGLIEFTGEVKEILHDRVFNFEAVEK
ncbi:MAG: glycoside hydrolase family 3 C-terminal domain-containing protein [Holdemanella sp.]|nr:glycoside hydrolase family 3 C-terminal domain-containing protein [Holdemanella sp.]